MQARKLRTNATIIWIFLFCLTQLSGCSFIGRKFSRADGAPSVNIDASKIPDAVPRVEHRSKYGNNDYAVEGRRYHVLKSAKGYNKVGYASWYGTKFHGRYTSTNERYNLFTMTAASPELPLPTYVQVTNLSNGRKVIVKVNDRGPFRCNRILDLSYVAAKKLGYVGHGTAKVRVVAIDPKAWNSSKNSSHSQKHTSSAAIYLQVGAYTKLTSAENQVAKVKQLTSQSVRIKHQGKLYRVQVGPFTDTDSCDHAKQLFVQHGYNHLLVVK
jgi:rare lipoprotein A